MDSCDEYSSRSDTPISTIDVENDDILQDGLSSCSRLDADRYEDGNYSDDEMSSSNSSHSNDLSTSSTELKSKTQTDENRPKLSFGISAILGDVIRPKAKSPIRNENTNTNITRTQMTSPLPDSPDVSPPFSCYPCVGPDGRPMIPRGSPPLGLVHPAFMDLDYPLHGGSSVGGLIRVPAHRPPLAQLGFSPLMFPWMQERKERLAGKNISVNKKQIS